MKIFHNANIYTPENPSATAFVVEQGRFFLIGSDDGILNNASKAELVTNLQGRTVMPGLIDGHLHLRHLAESMAMVNCEVESLDLCLSKVEKAAKQLHPGKWLRGHGWNHNRWDAGYGTARLLDAVSADHPVYLTAKSLHAAWVNSKALELAGIDENTKDPPGGIIMRNDQGKPTGILFEAGAMKLVEAIIPQPTQAELIDQIRALIPELWKFGLVGVHDFDGFDCWNALQTLYQRRELGLRVQKIIPFDYLENFIQTGLRTDFGDDWLHLGGVKLFSDGALGPQTAAMLQPYEGSNQQSTLLLEEAEIFEIGKLAVSHGIALSVHAIGDLANRVVLNAIERLRSYESLQSLPHFPHRIEHAQILDPADIPRFAELGVIASIQPIHAPSDMEMAEKYLGTRSKFSYAYKSIIDSGARTILGSDAPVESVNPFLGIHAAVTRRLADGSPGENGWWPEQRLTLSQTIDGYSTAPANAANRGNRFGKIAQGNKADFLILDEDPFVLETHELRRIQPVATFIEGKCVFQERTLPFDLK